METKNETLTSLNGIRRAIAKLIRMTGDKKGPLEFVGEADQVGDSAEHLLLCLDAMIKNL